MKSHYRRYTDHGMKTTIPSSRSTHSRLLDPASSIQVSCHSWLDRLKLLAQLCPHSLLQLRSLRSFHERSTWSNLTITQILAMGLSTFQASINQSPRAHFRCPAHDQLQQLDDRICDLAHQLGMTPSWVHEVQGHISQTSWMLSCDCSTGEDFEKFADLVEGGRSAAYLWKLCTLSSMSISEQNTLMGALAQRHTERREMPSHSHFMTYIVSISHSCGFLVVERGKDFTT